MYGFLIKCKDELQLLFEGKKNMYLLKELHRTALILTKYGWKDVRVSFNNLVL